MQAVMSFAQEAATMLASNTAAQEELMRAGTALTDIAQMYGESDDAAAGALTFSCSAMTRSGRRLRAGARDGCRGVAG